jgi:hypothetical protein
LIQDNLFDGHVNRNIRLALALIDMVQPSIEIVSEDVNTKADEVTLIWRVNGCYQLNQARATIGTSEPHNVLPSPGHCNYLGTQTVFTTRARQNESVILEAIVDQSFGKGSGKKADPEAFTGRPQLHLSRMRVQESYEVRHNGRVLKGGRVIALTKDACKRDRFYRMYRFERGGKEGRG